jgi:hypothetical protein
MKFFSGNFFYNLDLGQTKIICSILSSETRSKSLYPAVNTLPTEVRKKMLRTDTGPSQQFWSKFFEYFELFCCFSRGTINYKCPTGTQSQSVIQSMTQA